MNQVPQPILDGSAPISPEVKEFVYSDGSRQTLTVVRLFRKRSEFGWMLWTDALARQLVPGWFNYLRWAITIAGLEYAHQITKSAPLGLIKYISALGLWRYYIAVFEQYYIHDFLFCRSHRSRQFITTVMAGILAGGAFALARFVASSLPH
jgi:hypothetical protein